MDRYFRWCARKLYEGSGSLPYSMLALSIVAGLVAFAVGHTLGIAFGSSAPPAELVALGAYFLYWAVSVIGALKYRGEFR